MKMPTFTEREIADFKKMVEDRVVSVNIFEKDSQYFDEEVWFDKNDKLIYCKEWDGSEYWFEKDDTGEIIRRIAWGQIHLGWKLESEYIEAQHKKIRDGV